MPTARPSASAPATSTPTVAPTTAPRPSGSPEPRASSAATPSPRPTAPQPSEALFSESSNGEGVTEYNAENGLVVESFAKAYQGYFTYADNSENIYFAPFAYGGATIQNIVKLAVGGASALATLVPSAPPYLTYVAPTGKVASVVLTTDSDGDVTDYAVDIWDPGATGPPSRMYDYGTNEPYGYNLAVGPDGTVYIPYLSSGRTAIAVIDPETDNVDRTMFETLAPSSDYGFTPNWMAAAADGTLYIGEWSFISPDPDAGLYVFSSSGTESVVTSMDPGINGLDLDANGNVYVTSNNSSLDLNTYTYGPDTAQQFSVYSPHATTLLRQFQDHVPGVAGLTVDAGGTAYLIEYGNFVANGPPSTGAVYAIASGSSTVRDLIARAAIGQLSVFSNGTAKSARGRDAIAGSGAHGSGSMMGMSGLEHGRFLRMRRAFARH